MRKKVSTFFSNHTTIGVWTRCPKKYRLSIVLLSIVFVATMATAVHVIVKYHAPAGDKPLVMETDDDVLSKLPKQDPVKVEKPAETVKGSLVLTFTKGTSEAEKKAYIESIGGTIDENISALNTVVVKVDESKLDDGGKLKEQPENKIIAKVENDYYMEALEDASGGRRLSDEEIKNFSYDNNPVIFENKLDPEQAKPLFNDPDYKDQWALTSLKLEEKLADNSIGKATKEKIVAVIDSGVCLDHPDLAGKIVGGFDFVESDSTAQDELGHGCAVAGIIAANSNNEKGIVGAAPNVKIMPIRVLDGKGLGKYSDSANAIVYAVDHGADIINMSIGGTQDTELLRAAIEYAKTKGIPVVASTGNVSSDLMLYPAKYESVISVGSINSNLFVSKFSSHNKETDYFAPGESIVSLNIDGGTKLFTGTSFATPYITSLVANELIGSNGVVSEKGAPIADGTIRPVNFEINEEAIGWGTTEYDPKDVRTDIDEEFMNAQSSTACVTRYSQGWYSGALCYVEGIWERNTNTSYNYQIVTSGKKYNFIKSGASSYLGKYVRVELKYTGQYTFSILSIAVVNRNPIGDIQSVSDSGIMTGWAFDPDTPSTSIQIHVYIGAPSAPGVPVRVIYADAVYNDVNSAYGISGNHGISWSIPREYTSGTQTFYVYMINTQVGTNPQTSHSPKTVTFSDLQYNPTNSQVQNLSSNISTYGYFLPTGFNADILSEANQNISYTSHEIPDDPVNTATGFLNYEAVDLAYADVGGKPFEFRRAYNSDSQYGGVLGIGWQASFDMKIVPSLTNDKYGWTVLFPDGHGETFYDIDNNLRTFDSAFTAASSESKGVLYRYGSDGLPNAYMFIYVDSQTGQQFYFRGDNAAGNLYGKLVQIKYPNGTTVVYTYDTNGNLDLATEQTFNRTFDFTMSGTKLAQVTDAEGHFVRYEYDGNGRLQYVVNAKNGRTEYHYDESGRIDWVKDPNGVTIESFAYNTDKTVSSRTDGNGKTTTYQYSTEGDLKVTTITDPEGNATKHKHNGKNYLMYKVAPNGDTTEYTYDDKGNRLSEKLPDGKTYSYHYDTSGNRDTVTYPDNTVVSTTYNSVGKPTQITDQVSGNNRTKYFGYDDKNNLISSTDSAGQTTFYEYDANTKLLSKTMEPGTTTKWLDQYGANQEFDSTKMVRAFGDVNGDGKEDLVVFGMDGVYASISDGSKFGLPQKWSGDFCANYGWSDNTKLVRTLGDANGDGKADIIAFGLGEVYVALSTGNSFAGATVWINYFGYNQSWKTEYHPRMAADVNGDGKADIVGFADNGPRVALANSAGTGFNAWTQWGSEFGYVNGGWYVDQHPRTVVDVNGDRKADIVGFSSIGVQVALANSAGTGFNASTLWISDYFPAWGWSITNPRLVEDINGDGKADITGFGGYYMYLSRSSGSNYTPAQIIGGNFAGYYSIPGQGNWYSTNYDRMMADVTGDGKADIIGFSGDGVYVLNMYGSNVKTYSYDAHGYLNGQTDTSANPDETISYVNDATGNRKQTTDAENKVLLATYNELGKKATETDGNNNVTHYYYDNAGHLTSTVDANNVTTQYTYDGEYNVKQIIVNGAKITKYDYDDAGKKVKEISPEGNYIEYVYDVNGRVTNIKNYDKDANSLSQTATQYNQDDTKHSETDANGNTVVYSYDNLGRLSGETHAPAGGGTSYSKSYTHDFWGNLTSETDYEGNTYTYQYDKLDRKSVAKTPTDTAQNKSGTRYEYDAVGNVVKITDSLDQVTTQTFDTEKRLVSVTNPKGQTAHYSYFKNGKLKEQTNFASEKTSFTYDANNNLKTKIDNQGHVTTFDYNSRNLTAKVTDAKGRETTYAYDNYGNNTNITNAQNHSKVFSYDLNGNMLTNQDENGNVTSYAYDGLNRKISEKQNRAVNGTISEVTQTFTYDANGNMKTHVDGNTKTTEYSYDLFNRMTKIKNPDNTEKNMAYSGNGNLLASTDENGHTTIYTYDEMNRKKKEIDPENYSKEYFYDVLGRLTSEKDGKAQNTTYTYDQLGNVTTITDRDGKATTLAYDAGNRVITATYPNGLVVDTTYDTLGQKLSETRSGTGLSAPIVTNYTYDELGNVKTTTDGNNNVTTNNYDSLYRLVSVEKPLGLTVSNTYDNAGNVLSTTDENGAVTHYTYDSAGQVTKQTNALNKDTKFEYDANGNMAKMIDANNNETTFAYDLRNRKTQTTGAGNKVLEKLEYDGVGNVTKKIDGNNNNTIYTYYLNDKVKTVKDPYQNVTAYEYDGNGNVIRQTNKLGKDIHYMYSPMDKLVQKTDEMDYVWNYTYDAVGNLLTATDPKNRVSTNEYDVLSRKTKTTIANGEAGDEVTSYQYDKNGNLIKTIDPRGNAVTNTYDALGRMTRSVNDQNEATEFTYDGIGNILTTKDAEGNVTHYTYDDLSQKTQVKDPQNNITAYSYDDVGNLLYVTKPNANQERYNYDGLNRVSEYIDGENNKTTYEYDNNGNMVSKKNPNGTVYFYSFDALNRNTQSFATASTEGATPVVQSTATYDALGRTTSTTDAMNHTTSFVYDDLGRLKTVTDALNGATNYSYDEVGNLTSEKNANNKTTSYEYDVFDNMKKETDPEGKVWSYEYDKNGNVVKETDAKGQVNVRDYDKANRLTAKKYMDGETIEPESMYFEYDKNGNMKKAYKKNANGTISIQNDFVLDSRSSVTSTSDNRGYNQSYSYDNNGNLSSLIFNDGKTESYGYNANDKVTSLTTSYNGDSITNSDPKSLVTTFAYDVNGNLTKQVNPDKTVTKNTYNYLDQVTEVNNYMSAGSNNDVDYVLAKYNYTLNANGQKVITDFYSNCDKTNNCASNIEVSTHDTYTYDALGRVKSTQRTIDNPTATIEKFAYTNTYTYDAVGNRTQLVTSESGTPVTISYTYNGNNQLLNESSSTGSWTYTYDNNGNRLTKTNASTNEYVNNTWDRANNLAGVESALKNVEGTLENYKVNYTYDALGRRVTRTPDSSVANDSYNNITKQNYVYSGASWDMTSEYTDRTTGTDVHTNYLTANLGKGTPTLIASEDVQERAANSDVNAWTKVADESSSELDPEHNFIITPDSVQKFAYYQRDELDSIVSKTNLEVRYKGFDSTGTLIVNPTLNIINIYKVANQNRTDEYGKKLNDTQTTPESGTTTDNWSTRGYSGQVYDIESATYYYGSRNYDPANGTWTKQDSYRGTYTDPETRNRYAFVEEDPVNKIDKYGYSSTTSNLLALGLWAVTHPKQTLKAVNTFLKDPKRTTTAVIVYAGTYYQTKGDTKKAKQAASRVMTNNQQYEKAYKAIKAGLEAMAKQDEIDRKVQQDLANAGFSLAVDCRYQSSPICTERQKEQYEAVFGQQSSALINDLVGYYKGRSNQSNQQQQSKKSSQIFGRVSDTINKGLGAFIGLLDPNSYKTNIPTSFDRTPRLPGSDISQIGSSYLANSDRYAKLAEKYHVGDIVIIGGAVIALTAAGPVLLPALPSGATISGVIAMQDLTAVTLSTPAIQAFAVGTGIGAVGTYEGIKACKNGKCGTMDYATIGVNATLTAYMGYQTLSGTYQGVKDLNTQNNLPTITFDSKRTPSIAQNIQNAQENGAPSILTRTTNQNIIASNRSASLFGQRASFGMSLDEYPFASTYQGGNGACVLPVPAIENSIQGGMLSNFYKQYNINDGDKFIVKLR